MKPTLLFLLVLLGCNTLVAQQISPKQRFLNEYPSQVEDLKAFYGRLSMVVDYSLDDENDGHPEIVQREQYKATDGSYLRRVDIEKHRTLAPQTTVAVANQRLSFGLERLADGNEYRVTGLGPADGYPGKKASILWAGQPLRAAFGLRDMDCLDFLNQAGVTISEVGEIRENGRSLMQVSWVGRTDDYGKPSGFFVFAPNDVWALHKWMIRKDSLRTPGAAGYAVGIIEYDGSHDGFPLIKRVRSWSEVHAPGKPKSMFNVETYSVVELTPGRVPASDFTLAAFGISEPQGERTNYWFHISLTVTLFLFVVAGWSYYLHFRGRTTKRRT